MNENRPFLFPQIPADPPASSIAANANLSSGVVTSRATSTAPVEPAGSPAASEPSPEHAAPDPSAPYDCPIHTTPYRVFSRADWARLRADTPMTLAPHELAQMSGVIEELSVEDVEELSRVLLSKFTSIGHD